MDRHLGVLGYPLSHSISPAFQQAALDYHGLPITFHAWSVPPEGLADRVAGLRELEMLGANVTVPHKEAVGGLLDRIDSSARTVGAVNVIAREDRMLVGYNTDVRGFIKSLKDRAGFDPRAARVLLLGAGGAARAAAFGLVGEGIASIAIANRTVERARSLADELNGRPGSVPAVGLPMGEVGEAATHATLIVNSTSAGMSSGDARGSSPLGADQIPTGALVYDMVYNPPETPLMVSARRAGARAVGGLWMLIHQGAAAFEIWTGRNAPVEVMHRAAAKALAGG